MDAGLIVAEMIARGTLFSLYIVVWGRGFFVLHRAEAVFSFQDCCGYVGILGHHGVTILFFWFGFLVTAVLFLFAGEQITSGALLLSIPNNKWSANSAEGLTARPLALVA